jgi:flagellar hook-basal body complex protein FliE
MSINAIGSLGPSYPLPAGRYGSVGSAGAVSGVSSLDDPSPAVSLLNGPSGESSSVDPSQSISGLQSSGSYAIGGGFGNVLAGALRDAVVAGNQSAAMGEGLARGTNDDIHGTMISAKEADISLKLVGSVRNKLLDAFHELWRTNV